MSNSIFLHGKVCLDTDQYANTVKWQLSTSSLGSGSIHIQNRSEYAYEGGYVSHKVKSEKWHNGNQPRHHQNT